MVFAYADARRWDPTSALFNVDEFAWNTSDVFVVDIRFTSSKPCIAEDGAFVVTGWVATLTLCFFAKEYKKRNYAGLKAGWVLLKSFSSPFSPYLLVG